jgi:hypothetical protein
LRWFGEAFHPRRDEGEDRGRERAKANSDFETEEVRRLALVLLRESKCDSGIKAIFLASLKSSAAAEKVRIRLNISRRTAFYQVCQLCAELVINLRNKVTLLQ